jgi:hypothetical protein
VPATCFSFLHAGYQPIRPLSEQRTLREYSRHIIRQHLNKYDQNVRLWYL